MNHQKTNTHWKNHPWQETEVCQWPWKPLQSGYVCRCSFLSYILHLKKENSRLSKFRKWRRLKENQIQGVTPVMASISWAEFLPSVVTVGEKRQHYDRITDANTLNVNLFIIFLFFFSAWHTRGMTEFASEWCDDGGRLRPHACKQDSPLVL